MTYPNLTECRTAAEVIENFKAVRKRMLALRGPTDPEEATRAARPPAAAPEKPASPAPEPEPETNPPNWRAPRTVVAKVTIREIQVRVARRHDMTRAQLLSTCRRRWYVEPRHMAIFIVKRLIGGSYSEIARYFGLNDHTSILHALRKSQVKYNSDPDYRAMVDELEAEMGPAPGDRRLVR